MVLIKSNNCSERSSNDTDVFREEDRNGLLFKNNYLEPETSNVASSELSDTDGVDSDMDDDLPELESVDK